MLWTAQELAIKPALQAQCLTQAIMPLTSSHHTSPTTPHTRHCLAAWGRLLIGRAEHHSAEQGRQAAHLPLCLMGLKVGVGLEDVQGELRLQGVV